MLATLLAGYAIALQDPANPFDDVPIRQDLLLTRDGADPRLMIQQPQGPLPAPKKGPKDFGVGNVRFDFEWITWGFVRPVARSEDYELRFRVYSQERKPDEDTAQKATRMLLRLWDWNHERLKLDHSEQHLRQLVNVYLTWGGKAGGEQFIAPDIEGTRQVSTNNIFIYDIASFSQPVEMVRELAHEYGHATLPPVGTYSAPEDWANGFLGEKLYLSWIRTALAKDELTPEDFMGVTPEALHAWLGKHVDPLVLKSASSKPSPSAMTEQMDAYTGFATYMGQILPGPVFGRSLKLIGSQSARDYPAGVLLAVEEPDVVPMNIPVHLQGKKIWIPVGKGKVTGAKVLQLSDGWAHIEAGSTPVVVTARRS